MLHVYRQITGLSNFESIILTQKRIHAEKFPYDGERVFPLSRPNGLMREWRRFWYRKCRQAPWPVFDWERREMESIIRESGAELLHVYFGHSGMHLLPLLESRTRPVPVIVSFHGADAGVDMDKPGYLKAMRAVFKGADRILARSESLAQELRQLGCPQEKIRISRTGIPLDQWPVAEREAVGDGQWRLVQACRLIEKKGLDVSLRMMAKLRGRFPQLRLAVLGEGPLRAELESLAGELGIGEAVEFAGFVDEQRLREEFARAHVFLQPSRTAADGNQEGVPNAMLEAMATGLPVAGTRHGGIPEAVEDGVSGILVEENDWQSLADRLGDLLEDGQQWKQAGLAARAAVESGFSQQRQIASLEEIYRELIG